MNSKGVWKVIRNPMIDYLSKIPVIYAIDKHMCFEWNLIWAGNTPRVKDHPTGSMRRSALRYWSGFFMRLPNHYRIFLLLLVAPNRWKVNIAEDTIYFRHRARKPQSSTDLKASSLWTSFHDIRRYQASFQKREATNSSTQLWLQQWPTGTITLGDQWWHTYSEGNQKLSNWTWGKSCFTQD